MTRPSPADYAGVQVRHDARLRLDLVGLAVYVALRRSAWGRCFEALAWR